MKIKIVVHKAEEGGFWAEVPSLPGCVTQGENCEEILKNTYEAVELTLSVDMTPPELDEHSHLMEIALCPR